MSDVIRWRCKFCREIFLQSELLSAPHPFSTGSIPGCPRCKNTFGTEAEVACDEPGCDEDASCGWPSPEGYRHAMLPHEEE